MKKELKTVEIETFKNAFLKQLETALNATRKTITDSERIIINEFVKQAKNNGFTKLAGGKLI